MSEMFCHCEELECITALANWSFARVEDICELFLQCDQLQDMNVSSNSDILDADDLMKSMFH